LPKKGIHERYFPMANLIIGIFKVTWSIGRLWLDMAFYMHNENSGGGASPFKTFKNAKQGPYYEILI